MYSDSVGEVSPWGEEKGGHSVACKYLGTGEDLDYIRGRYPAIASIFLNQEGPICYVVALKKNTSNEDRPPERINGIGVWM